MRVRGGVEGGGGGHPEERAFELGRANRKAMSGLCPRKCSSRASLGVQRSKGLFMELGATRLIVRNDPSPRT